MATEFWQLNLVINGAEIYIKCHNFNTISNIFDALMELEREDLANPD
jgi:hypothetical protein